MEPRRHSPSSLTASLKLALVLSAAAVVLAFTLHAAGGVDRIALVAAILTVGFVTSWVSCGRQAIPAPARARRVTVVPMRHRVG